MNEAELSLDEFLEALEKLRLRVLFSKEADSISHESLEGEQYLLLAIGALEQAERFAQLALYKVRQARAAGRIG